MLIIDLDELKKAKELIDIINSAPLNCIVWQKNGNAIEVNSELVKMWSSTGMSNHLFAYAALLSNIETKEK